MKACKNCSMLVEDMDTCPNCGSTELSKDWQGYVVIVDHSRSEIAKRLNITVNGRYALKVR